MPLTPRAQQVLIYRDCFSQWGYRLQAYVLIEELAELQHAVARALRSGQELTPEMVEEFADVQIMLDEFFWYFRKDKASIEAQRITKLQRLRERLDTSMQIRRRDR